MGGGGDAVNTEDQQVLILLHECPTETSRHAKGGGGKLSPLCPSVLLSLPTCRTLTLFFLHWWICVPQHSSRELQRQSQLSFWPVTFFVWNDWALLTLLSWHFIGSVLVSQTIQFCAVAFRQPNQFKTWGNTSDQIKFYSIFVSPHQLHHGYKDYHYSSFSTVLIIFIQLLFWLWH